MDVLQVDDGNPFGEPGKYDRVEVEVQDREALRALTLVSGIRASTVSVRLRECEAALPLVARPEWPPLESLDSRRSGAGCVTVLTFVARVSVPAIVAELARQAVWPDRVGQRGLVVHRFGGPDRDKVPADVCIADWHLGSDDEGEPPVTGRPPLLLASKEAPFGPVDERVHNPAGFVADDSPVPSVDGLDAGQVARLAMRGVPLSAGELDPEVAAQLGERVTAAITAPVDLADPQAREEHSIVLRRAAFDELSTVAWRRKLGELAGVRVHHQPSVSVVLATRRPEMLDHALEQVARQRGVDALELVLAPHGFDAEAAQARDVLGAGIALQLVSAASDTLFGDVLNQAAQAAGGDVVLKMDDDDWYSPDFVADLLRARAYSGAELVGAPDDLYYLEDRDLTLRLGHQGEVYRPFVAGGTTLLDRTLLREVGGFRSVRRHVDAQLIAAVRDAGGAVYRIHGLGYVMRRAASGHTWDADLDDLVARAVQSWPGFRPGRLMEL